MRLVIEIDTDREVCSVKVDDAFSNSNRGLSCGMVEAMENIRKELSFEEDVLFGLLLDSLQNSIPLAVRTPEQWARTRPGKVG